MSFINQIGSGSLYSFLDESDLDFIQNGQYVPEFGTYENDVLECSIFDYNNNLLSWSVDYPSNNFTEINTIYNGTDGVNYPLNYKLFKGYFQNSDGNLLINPVFFLQQNNLPQGDYKIKFFPTKNFLGSDVSNEKLKVISINNNGTQVNCVPNTSYNATSSEEINFNKQYNDFIQNKIYVKYISQEIINQINSPELNQNYQSVKKSNQNIFNEISLNYAFINDSAYYNFIFNVYSIISNYYQYFILSNYDSVFFYDEIKNVFYNYIISTINSSLNQIRSTLTPYFQKNHDQYVNFFFNIFAPTIDFDSIFENYSSNFFGIFKYSLNFGNDNIYPYLNFTTIPQDNNHTIISFLIEPSILNDISIGDYCWIINNVALPIEQEYLIYGSSPDTLNYLQGPNLQLKTQIFGSSTKQLSYSQLTKNQSSLQKINSYFSQSLQIGKINVDYRYFENFINFSSAQQRLNNYNYKLTTISQLSEEQNTLLIEANNNLDIYYQSESIDLNTKTQTVLNSFDGYENFLYQNPNWYDIHSSQVGAGANSYTSASLYDSFNNNNLLVSTPEFIRSNSDNQDYLTFVQMIGQFFDQIWLHIKEMPSLKYPENNDDLGISKELIWNILSSFGFELDSGFNDTDLLLSILGQDGDGNTIETTPSQDRTKTIWRRILACLPYMLKTKGSQECIKYLLSCYGIPDGLFRIREFSGLRNSYIQTNDSNFIFDSGDFSLRFISGSEYLSLPFYSGSQTVEMKFAFDTSKNYISGSQYQLFSGDDTWACGLIRDVGTYWGRGYFTIQYSGSYLSAITDKVPVFNGDTFSFVFRKYDKNIYFDPTQTTSSIDLIPLQYEIIVTNNQEDSINFDQRASVILSSSYNTTFKSASILYFGNYNSPASFYGNVEQIKVWKRFIPDDRIASHVMFNDSYDSDDYTTNVSDLLVNLNFINPTNLYTSSNVSYIQNESYNQNFVTYITASNFPDLDINSQSLSDCKCDTIDTIISASFPWQFSEKIVTNYASVPSFGSPIYSNSKIRLGSQSLVAPLSPTERATERSITLYQNDTNKVGVYFSPIDLVNDDILKFFGNLDLSDIIGTPANVYDRQYTQLKSFILSYFKYGSLSFDNIFYINVVKSYFDKSIFKQIEKLVPAKSKLITGLLIEPHILERPKIKYSPPIVLLENNFASSLNVKPAPKSSLFPRLSDTVSFNFGVKENAMNISGLISQTGNSSFENNYFTYIEDDPLLFKTYTQNGLLISLEKTDVYYTTKYYKLELFNKKFSKASDNGDGTFSTSSKNIKKLNLIPISSIDSFNSTPLTFSDSIIYKGSNTNHSRYRRRIFKSISRQDSTTTIDPTSGIENGSLPIVSTQVDSGTLSVGNQNSGVILNTNS